MTSVEQINEEWLERFARLQNKKDRTGVMKFERILEYLEDEGYDNIRAWEDVDAVKEDLNDRTRLKRGEFTAIKQAVCELQQNPPTAEPSTQPSPSADHKEPELTIGPPPPPPEDPIRVVPLLYPNNAEWDSETGRLSVDPDKTRNSLVVNPEALEFIANIKQKVGVISICGKARTGKSLIAGELASPQERPCPFDLGHYAAACTYGVWIGLRAVPHESMEDTVILVLDVEGTSFHDADPKSDYQLMVVTLLISSLLIYNVQKTFDGSSLDEIEFILKLSSKIACRRGTENADADTHILGLFFPVFAWLVRDAHLSFEVDEHTKNARDYFFNKILSPPQRGYSEAATRRAVIKRAFQEFFPSFDAFTLPPPAADQRLYGKLGTHALEQINPEFARQVNDVVRTLRAMIPAKKMITDVESQTCVTCTGPFLAQWIEQCVEQVNSGVPNIESIGQSVFRNRIEESCQKSCTMYREQIAWKVHGLRRSETDPVRTSQILEAHREILQNILCDGGVGQELIAVDDIDSDLSRFRVEKLEFFYDTIGHEDVAVGEMNEPTENADNKEREPGEDDPNEPPQVPKRSMTRSNVPESFIPRKHGILQEKIRENNDICARFCAMWLDEKYGPILAMIGSPSDHTMDGVLTAFDGLQTEYFGLHINGESAHEETWLNFHRTQWTRDQVAFSQYQDYDAKLVEERNRIAKLNSQMERDRRSMEEMKRRHEQAQKSMGDKLERQRREMEKKDRENQRRVDEMNRNFNQKTSQFRQEMSKLHEKQAKQLRESQASFRNELNQIRRQEQANRERELKNQKDEMDRQLSMMKAEMQRKENQYNKQVAKNDYISKLTNLEREIYQAALRTGWNAPKMKEQVPALQEYSVMILKGVYRFLYTWQMCYKDKFLEIKVPEENYAIHCIWHHPSRRKTGCGDVSTFRERIRDLSFEAESVEDTVRRLEDLKAASNLIAVNYFIYHQTAHHSESTWFLCKYGTHHYIELFAN